MQLGIFKRRATPRYDEHLTHLTVVQADEFRLLVREAFASVGRDVDVYPDRVEDHDGTIFGLENIAALCTGHDPADWREVVDDHIRRVTTPPKQLDELSDEEFKASLYLRLADGASVGVGDGYARPVAPGLFEVLSVELGDTVATPSLQTLSAHGTLDALRDRAQDNLRGLLRDGAVSAETLHRGGGHYTALTGASYFAASLALLLPEAIERFTFETDNGRGVLVAVPNRHLLLYRMVDTPDGALALHHMFDRAQRGFREHAGPLSPNVFWVRNHRWVPVTTTEGRKPKVVMDKGLADALRARN